jgi:hypothetical protein
LQSALPEFLGETDSVCNPYTPSTFSDPTTEQARLAVGRDWLAHGWTYILIFRRQVMLVGNILSVVKAPMHTA